MVDPRDSYGSCA